MKYIIGFLMVNFGLYGFAMALGLIRIYNICSMVFYAPDMIIKKITYKLWR